MKIYPTKKNLGHLGVQIGSVYIDYKDLVIYCRLTPYFAFWTGFRQKCKTKNEGFRYNISGVFFTTQK